MVVSTSNIRSGLLAGPGYLQSVQRAGNALATLLQDMRINHRRRHILVSQQGLDRADIGSPLKQMRRKTMPERVRADDFP